MTVGEFPPVIGDPSECSLCGRDDESGRGPVRERVFSIGLIHTYGRCYTRWLRPAAGEDSDRIANDPMVDPT